MSKTAEQSERYVTYGEFRHEIDRLDHRIEALVGAAEDRLIGRMAEMESRIMRRMDQQFEEFAQMMQCEFIASEARMTAMMDEKIAASEARMEAMVDKRIAASEARMETMIDDKIAASEARMNKKLDALRNEILGAIADLGRSLQGGVGASNTVQ